MNYKLRFFNKKKDFLTLKEVLEITDSKILKDYDLSLKINEINTLEKAQKGEISFLNSAQYFNKLQDTKAQFCLINEESAAKSNRDDIIFIINKNPYFAYSQIAKAFYEEKEVDFCEENIAKSAKIQSGTKIAKTAFIGNNVEIGKNCTIYPNAIILDNCKIGDNVVINSGAVISFAIIGNNCTIYSGVKIGQDGFGFAHHQGVNHKITQIGIVEIKDNVEIGSNSCIDRGAIENTIIGQGTKIDNLCQIAHNVVIGQGTVVAGMTAIAGSAKIGNFVQIGGKSSINGHITIDDGAKIAGMSGVMRDVEKMAVVGGAPALPIRQWHKLNANLIRLSKNKKSGDN